MAIRLRLHENRVRLNIRGDTVRLKVGAERIPIYPEAYTGETTVTPTRETQTLQTEGLMVMSNIIVNPIPSNYGLVTYNGSILTVS